MEAWRDAAVQRTHGRCPPLDAASERQFFGARDFVVRSCTADSRTVRPGDLFVALAGVEADGHDFAAAAVSRGASAVLGERMLPLGGAPQCVVPNARAAFGLLCQTLAGNPSRRLKVIGVTGTNGKTTTTALIAGVLHAAGHRVGTLGTLGYTDGYDWEPAPLTTPSPPLLATWLARLEASGCSHAVMEVSSHALTQSRLAGVTLDAGVVTNVRHDHLDYHGTLENYAAAKARLFDYIRPRGLVVLNADDPITWTLAPRLTGPMLSVGLLSDAELTATVIDRCRSEQTFLLTAGRDTTPVRTTLLGDHNIVNCLQAVAIGLAHGIDLETVVRGIESVDRVSGRLERIECGQPFGVFVDYAHTPHALAAALDTLRQVTDGKLICVFGAGGERDRAKRPIMGRTVESRADVAIVTTDNPRREDPSRIVDDILSGMRQRSRAQVIADRAAAIHRALSLAAPGDTVIVAGKGHEEFQILADERRMFDDREVARRWLYNLAPSVESSWLAGAWSKMSNS